MTRDEIVSAARSYLGVRFRKGGRSRTGLDCVGLVTLVAYDIGYEHVKDVTCYDFEPHPNLFLDTIRSQTNPVMGLIPKPGNVVMLRQSIYPMHCGIIGQNQSGLTVINANLHMRSVVEDPISNWKDMIIELRDYRGVS